MELAKRPISEQIRAVHLILKEYADYARLLVATNDDEAVEGSLLYDNCCAAIKIREKAKEMNLPLAAES